MIITARPSALNAANANPWQLRYINDQDGAELYVATAGITILLATAFLPLSKRLARFFGSPFIAACGMAAASIIILQTRSTEFIRSASLGTTVFVALFATIGLIAISRQRATQIRYWYISTGLGLIAAFAILFSGSGSSPEDYGYFIGPALKLFQGERLSSLYMQYGLFGTGVFAGMLKFGFTMAQMEMVITLLTILWFWFYWTLAGWVIRDPQIRILFLASLFIIRFMALAYHPAYYPQSSPLRLDLWVPLALILWKWWSRTFLTGICFATAFLVDSTFGLFAFAAFMALLAFQFVDEPLPREHIGRKIMVAAVPLLVAIVGRTIVFGGLISEPAKMYAKAQLGFLPITAHSLFWPILFAMAFSAIVVVTQADKKRKQFGFFLTALSALQMVYFFGRSHDHNLLCISGSWILLSFFALDSHRFRSANRRLILPISICIFMAVATAQRSRAKIGAIVNHLQVLNPFPIQEIDRDIEPYRKSWLRGDSNAVLFASDDAYWNYRLDLHQYGPYTPMFAAMFREETVTTLTDAINNGRVVLVNRSVPDSWIAVFNGDPLLVRKKEALTLEPIDGELRRLRIVTSRAGLQPSR